MSSSSPRFSWTVLPRSSTRYARSPDSQHRRGVAAGPDLGEREHPPSGTPKQPLRPTATTSTASIASAATARTAGGRLTSPRTATGAGPVGAQGRSAGSAVVARRGRARRGLLPPHRLHAASSRRPAAAPGAQLLSERQIKALVAYIATSAVRRSPSRSPQRGNLSQGQSLFTEHCAGCHQIVAQGGYVTGAVPPSLAQATPVQVAQAVRIGPYVMPKFS